MTTETKRGSGRPPGKYGSYVKAEPKRFKYQVTIPQGLIDDIKARARAEGISAGRLIEKTFLESMEDPEPGAPEASPVDSGRLVDIFTDAGDQGGAGALLNL